jgi:hypothetical protein
VLRTVRFHRGEAELSDTPTRSASPSTLVRAIKAQMKPRQRTDHAVRISYAVHASTPEDVISTKATVAQRLGVAPQFFAAWTHPLAST